MHKSEIDNLRCMFPEKTVFRKSRLHKLLEEKILGTELCIKFESEEILTTGDDCSNGYSKEEEVRSFVLRADEAMDCQQGEAKHSYRGLRRIIQ